MTFAEVMDSEYKAVGTLRAVADKCGITITDVERYRKGSNSPGISKALRILDVLGYRLTVKYNRQWIDFSINGFSNWFKGQIKENGYCETISKCKIHNVTATSIRNNEMDGMSISIVERILRRLDCDMDIIKY